MIAEIHVIGQPEFSNARLRRRRDARLRAGEIRRRPSRSA
jgi:hypothetical protein